MIDTSATAQSPQWQQPPAIIRDAEQIATDRYGCPIVDSRMTRAEALAQNPAFPAPQEIIQQQRLLEVKYHGFDGRIHAGQIVVNASVANDLRGFFKKALALHFPIEKVIPAAAPQYKWNDGVMMADNNTSGYNYRKIAGSNNLSFHAQGLAFDVNTFLNPYIYVDNNGNIVNDPEGSTYDPSRPGTLTGNHPLVKYLENRGWTWGGRWTLETDEVIDYQHFEKPAQN